MAQYNVIGLIAQNGAVITPSDSTVLDYDGFWMENNGTVKLEYLRADKQAGNTVTLNLIAGYHPRRIRRIFSTGSTIVGVIEGLKG